MLSTLLRPKRPRKRADANLQARPYLDRRATADFTEDDGEDENTEDEDEEGDEEDQEEDGQDEDEADDGDEDGEDTPLLPIFSAAHLDALPVYNLTHAIRLIVLPRTETTLTWEQLRSPQVSQFLVKPMQQQIRTSHFSRATLYALMANCLQFEKEAQANPGNAGNSRTRAMVCELLAIKLLKEYNTRELIDALSYDFFPLQGIAPEISLPSQILAQKNRPAAARVSTLEVAIRASAKRFIAHPVVVRQLEAIWAGTIVFHSAADNLHRRRPSVETNASCLHRLVPNQNSSYGTTNAQRTAPCKQDKSEVSLASGRRTVTLYDPRDASLFKLSRLRVPRYRQFFSTCSLAILLGLFLAVLVRRSMDITTLEIFFWFWSAGFMLDEVVGFNEQGFSLYILSFWNTFDLGILLLLVVYYLMRLCGIFLVDVGKHQWNSMAYDVLATNAVLLFPRLFSVLDHYKYFSQLLIAFRLMAIDLVAVSILVLIACSGFFVAFTFSFGKNEYDAAQVAYKIFQILMGFTPAAWEAWETYNPLGRALLVLFLFICHFLVVTILITVLTNSFMAIVSNADQEHQFVFAVNTISMVKNDALFSYVAPSNIFAWVLTPIRFLLPFRSFIKLNRNVIKATHFPLLFGIFAYEKLFLARSVFEPTDLVDNVKRGRKRVISFQDSKMGLLSPSIRLRQGSVSGYQKDRALDAVFRLTPGPGTLRDTPMGIQRSRTLNVVNNWMDQSGVASPPQEQDHEIVDRLEMRRRSRMNTLRQRGVSGARSIASDPAEFISTVMHQNRSTERRESTHQSDADDDGDDELATHDEDEVATLTKKNRAGHATNSNYGSDDKGYFRPQASLVQSPAKYSSTSPSRQQLGSKMSPRRFHQRNMSTNTILYNPLEDQQSSSSPPRSGITEKFPSLGNTGTHTPAESSRNLGGKHLKSIYTKTIPRPILPNRKNFQSVPNFNNFDALLQPGNSRPNKQPRHRRSSVDMAISELGIDNNDNRSLLGAVPSSFQTQMAMATGGIKAFGGRGQKGAETSDGMMGRLMLARMKTLEEGFAEIVREVKGIRTAGNSSVEGSIMEVAGKRRRGKSGTAGNSSVELTGVENVMRKGKMKEKEKEKERRKKSFEIEKTTSSQDFAISRQPPPKEVMGGDTEDMVEGANPPLLKRKGSSM